MPKPSKPKSKAAPAKPVAPAKPAKAAKPVKKSAPAKALKPAAKPLAKPSAKPIAKPAAKPTPKAAPQAPAKPAKATPAPSAKPTKSIAPASPTKSSTAPKIAGPTKAAAAAVPAKPSASKPLPKASLSGATPPAIPLPPAPIADMAIVPSQLDADGNPVNGENRPRPRGLSAMGKSKKPKPKKIELEMPKFESIYKPTGRKVTPLIASGPKNPPQFTAGPGIKDGEKIKPVFNKRDLDKYRVILVKKRNELAGDVESMESEALNQTSGGLSHTPQHVAEQGSDTFDQDNSLRLAQKERELIKEIDDAIKRVDAGSYGVCELMRKPITLERLAELPWTRYCIDGARALERQRSIPGGVAR